MSDRVADSSVELTERALPPAGQADRHGSGAPVVAQGWSLERLVPPSGLFGANGIQFGPDGRLYVAQAFGSQISAVDVDTGRISSISPQGDPIVGPDDVAFDSKGNLYATEVMSARVCTKAPSGEVRIIADQLPSANGVTVYRDRLFIDEFRRGGRLFELYPDGRRAPRLVADDLAGPNALAAGPDGKLYFPQVHVGEIWRIDPDSGERERVADGLKAPPAVKWSPRGELIVPQAQNGEIVRIDVQSGRHTVVARTRPGIDNLAFDPSGRLFVSHFVDGGIVEVAIDGSGGARTVVPPGYVGPWGIAVDGENNVHVADGLSMARIAPDGTVTRGRNALDPRSPGFVRSLCSGAAGELWLTTARGDVVRYRIADGRVEPLATKLPRLGGIALGTDGSPVVAATAEGAVLRIGPRGEVARIARGLEQPWALEAAADGGVYVGERATGRVLHVDPGGRAAVVVAGFREPRALARRGDALFILDSAAHTLTLFDLARSQALMIARKLPVGGSGPIAFSGGLAVGRDGSVLIAADAEGSILRLDRARARP